eukprot:8536987-Pyramimonas_sp.AAC.1
MWNRSSSPRSEGSDNPGPHASQRQYVEALAEAKAQPYSEDECGRGLGELRRGPGAHATRVMLPTTREA